MRRNGHGAQAIRATREDRFFYLVVNIFVGIFTLIILIPLINIVASSFSSPSAVSSGRYCCGRSTSRWPDTKRCLKTS